MSKYKYNNNLAYAVNTVRTVIVKGGNINEDERCQMADIRREKMGRRKKMYEDKRDNV